MKKYYVNALSELIGTEITEFFVLNSITNNINRKGTKWSDCVFSDTTGTIAGVLWVESMDQTYHSYIGQVVKVQGTIVLNEGKIELHAISLSPVNTDEYTMDDFIYQIDESKYLEYKKVIISYINGITNLTVKNILLSVYNDKMFQGMKNLPAGIKYHHNYNGGLLTHIIGVTKTAEFLLNMDIEFGKHKSYYSVPNRDVVIGGALLHDIGKIYEYTPFPMANFTKKSLYSDFIIEGNNLLAKAYTKASKVCSVDENILMQLQHILLTSHATKKLKHPKTKEALIVYNADLASSQIDGFDTSFKEHDDSKPGNVDSQTYSNFLGYTILRSDGSL